MSRSPRVTALLLVMVIVSTAVTMSQATTTDPQKRTVAEEDAAAVYSDERRAATALLDSRRATEPDGLSSLLSELLASDITHNDTALAALAELYLLGDSSVAIDVPKAFEFASLAALKGNPRAHALLGFMYSSGVLPSHLTEDQELAQLHFLFSAQGGDAIGMMASATRALRGHGRPHDCQAAWVWLSELSAEVADASWVQEEATGLGFLPKQQSTTDGRPHFQRLEETMEWSGAEELEATDHDTLTYYQWTADGGDPVGLVGLGEIKAGGLYGEPQDFAAARELFKEAIEQGEFAGKAGLAMMAEKGLGQAVDNSSALHLYREAASAGNVAALTRLGKAYLFGELGVKRDEEQGVKMLDEAAHRGSASALVLMGDQFISKRDSLNAAKYYTAAVVQGSLTAMHELAMINDENIRKTTAAASSLTASEQQNCMTAVMLLVKVAMNGDWIKTRMWEAERLAWEGAEQSALMRYLLCSEMGVEEAQANAAWLLVDSGEAERASRYLKMSAEQATLSEVGKLKVSDEAFAGNSYRVLGDLAFNKTAYSDAFEYYSAAGRLGNQHALFDLGWMYEWGFGVTKQDFPLAKRHYDMAIEYSRGPASMAAYLALCGLAGHFVVSQLSQIPSDLLWIVALSVLATLVLILRHANRIHPHP